MTVYILGAGASWCTDAYGEKGVGIQNEFKIDYRPPLLAGFFDAALKVGPFVGKPEDSDLRKMLSAAGLTIEGLAANEPPGANLKTAFSLVDLAKRLLGERLSQRKSGARPSRGLQAICAGTKGQPVFGENPLCVVDSVARSTLIRARAAAKSAPGDECAALAIAYSYAGMALEELHDAFLMVCAPTTPYRWRDARRCSNYSSFARHLRGGDAVITFNYDFLLDRALEEIANLRSSPGEPLPTLLDVEGGRARYLKLHGSVLWYVEYLGEERDERFFSQRVVGTAKYVNFAQRLAAVNRGGEWLPPQILQWIGVGWAPAAQLAQQFDDRPYAEQVAGTTQIEPLIVPPTAEKSWRPEIATLWRRAKTELARTERIYVIGFSFPPTDSHIREKLTRPAGERRKRGNYRDARVRIVTRPNASEEEQRELEDKARDAFRGADVSIEKDEKTGCTLGFREWLETYNPDA